MGAKQSTAAGSPRVHAGRAGATQGLGVLAHHHHRGAGTSSRSGGRQRARSLSSVWNGHAGQPMAIPADHSAYGPPSGSPDSDNSTPEDLPFGRVFAANSLPVQLVSFNGVKCPVCSKFVFPDDVECHLVMCLTKPRIIYNEDVLTEDKGECAICLEELVQGDTIARLPCLCIYHKNCIDSWFEVNRSCPEHPLD